MTVRESGLMFAGGFLVVHTPTNHSVIRTRAAAGRGGQFIVVAAGLQIDSEMVPETPDAPGHTASAMIRTAAASPKPIRSSLVVPRSSVRARWIATPI